MTSGIYKITNTETNKCYIGSAINTAYRFSRHKRDLRNNRHGNEHLQKAWNKYGENCFTFELLEECDKNNLLKREQYYIDTINPDYNICKTAGSQLGRKHSNETKQKMSLAKKGHKYGVGRKMTDKMLEALKNSRIGLPSPFKGKHHSDKVKKAQSERMKGHKYGIGRKPSLSNLEKMKEARRKKSMEKLDNKKKIDYLNLDISDWLEKRKENTNE